MEILKLIIYAVSENLKTKWKKKESFLSKEKEIHNLVTFVMSEVLTQWKKKSVLSKELKIYN